jgi:type II secretory pathway pseudopilin PulG
MAALLVAIGLMSVFMSAALPTWRQAAKREKEAELVWRGRQYDRAIQLFRRRYGAPGPPSIDTLVEGRFLRKKYLDPMTGREFELRPVTAMGTVEEGETDEQQPETGKRPSRRRTRRPTPTTPQRAAGQLIGGVRSTSKERSIMVLNGRTRYNEWEFAYVPYQDRMGQPPGGQNPNMPGITPRGRTPRGRTPSQRSPTSSGRDSAPSPSRTPR